MKTKNNGMKSANYWTSRVNKLAKDQSVDIPDFGRVTNYREANGVVGVRRFKISKSKIVSNGANLTIAKISERLNSVLG